MFLNEQLEEDPLNVVLKGAHMQHLQCSSYVEVGSVLEV